MKIISLVFASLILLAACSTTPEQYLAQQPVEVDSSDLDTYWVPEDVDFRLTHSGRRATAWSGSSTARFLIDSNGNTFDAQIIESTGDRDTNRILLQTVEQSKYRPADTNSSHTPVYTTMEMSFELERVE